MQWYKDDIEIFSCERIEIKEEEEGGAVILKGNVIIISVLPTKRIIILPIQKKFKLYIFYHSQVHD